MAVSAERRGSKQGAAGLALFLLPLPLLLKAVVSLWSGDFPALLSAGGAYSGFVAAALLMRRGLRGEQDYAARPFAMDRPPPLKAMAAALVGVATGFAAFAAAGHAPAIATCFGIAAAAGTVLFYGRDPGRRSVPSSGAGGVGEEGGAMLADAYRRLDLIDATGRELASVEFKQRLASIVTSIENILKLIEKNPRDIRRARKFLKVYLEGAQRIADQYARTHRHETPAELEHNFRTLLVDMENTCNEQYEKLLQDDVLDLDVQIEVLSARLRQEGVP